MNELTLNAFQIITSYGGIGAALAYFMVKDYTQSQKRTDTDKLLAISMEKLVIAINTLTNCNK